MLHSIHLECEVLLRGIDSILHCTCTILDAHSLHIACVDGWNVAASITTSLTIVLAVVALGHTALSPDLRHRLSLDVWYQFMTFAIFQFSPQANKHFRG